MAVLWTGRDDRSSRPLSAVLSASRSNFSFLCVTIARRLEIRLPVSGRERCPGCHSERSEESLRPSSQTLRCAQGDRHYLQISELYPHLLTAWILLHIICTVIPRLSLVL